MALNKLELTTPSLMSSEPDDYTEKNIQIFWLAPLLYIRLEIVHQVWNSRPGQSGCDGWTPVTQAESRRRPEHGNGTKANPKIPDYSGSELPVNFASFFIANLTLRQALLFIVERLTTVTTGNPLPQAQLHHAPEQRSE